MYKEVYKAASGGYQDVDIQKGEAVIKFATYGSKDRDGDIANQGMFKKSWDEFKDVRLFKNHDKTLAPGKILKMWDDANHAYAHVKFGSSTLGQDTLKDVHDEIITDSSYLFVPQKAKQLVNGGYNYTEVFHKEVSVLTHWGAHPESKIKAVRKAWDETQIGAEVLKELSSTEVIQLKNFIATFSGNLQDLVTLVAGLQPGSDLYTWIHDVISTVNSSISSFKYRIQWYGPREKSENDELLNRLSKMKAYCKNTSASDEHINELLKEVDSLEAILSGSTGSTQSSPSGTQEQHKGMSGDSEVNLHLLNLSMLLDK